VSHHRVGNPAMIPGLTLRNRLYACRRKMRPMTGMKYSLLASSELDRMRSAARHSRVSIASMFSNWIIWLVLPRLPACKALPGRHFPDVQVEAVSQERSNPSVFPVANSDSLASRRFVLLRLVSSAEIQQLEKKNLALEALRKLLNDEIRSRSITNVVETKRFSERLESAIARYHTNAVSTVEVLKELIDLAIDVRAARRRGEEEGLSQDEIAFYDALAESRSAVELMGNVLLKVIAHELLVTLKAGATVDWSHRENARARMRVLVKRILRKHGYPPDLQDAAVQTVLRQAEALSSQWATQ
jgi:hypothetical protein